jgi:hypothetical protein
VTTAWGFDVTHPLTMPGSVGDAALIRGALYRLRVEFVKATQDPASIQLYWQSARSPHQLISPFFLYPAAEHVHGSPFSIFLF